jgi:hypothetical protein
MQPVEHTHFLPHSGSALSLDVSLGESALHGKSTIRSDDKLIKPTKPKWFMFVAENGVEALAHDVADDKDRSSE